jgi:hypothetical protein
MEYTLQIKTMVLLSPWVCTMCNVHTCTSFLNRIAKVKNPPFFYGAALTVKKVVSRLALYPPLSLYGELTRKILFRIQDDLKIKGDTVDPNILFKNI